MKKFKITLFYLFLVLFSVACQSTRAAPISSDIIDSTDIVKKTNLDSAYLSLDTLEKYYYAGFIISGDGINHPTLLELDKVTGKIDTWNFDEIISDIFIFNSKVSLVLDGGNSFSLQERAWRKNSLILEEQSRVVFSDSIKHLISCSPASSQKSAPNNGGCQSHNPSWQYSFPWLEVRPKVCGNNLYVVTWEKPTSRHIAIDIKSGKVTFEKSYSGEDICTVFE